MTSGKRTGAGEFTTWSEGRGNWHATEALPCPPAPPTVGDLVDGRYRLVRELGGGGHGVVFVANDQEAAREVVLKFLVPRIRAAVGEQTHPPDELAATASLSHPAIAAPFDLGEHKGLRYLASRYFPTPTLAHVLAQSLHLRPGGPGRIGLLRLLPPLMDAVAHAHAKGVRHRDIKPSNILVAEDFSSIVLIDFSIAHVRGTGPAIPGGTHTNMAPEQARGEDLEFVPAVDIYALGVLLVQVITGRDAWQGSAASVRQLLMANPVPPPIPPIQPAGLGDIVRRAMAPRADDRFERAEEMAAALRGWLRERDDHERALVLLTEARRHVDRAHQCRSRLVALGERADTARAQLPPAPTDDELCPVLQLEDKVKRIRRAAEEHDQQAELHLRGTLAVHPQHPTARQELAELLILRHGRAEQRAETGTAARTEVLLRDLKMPSVAKYLSGDGAVSVMFEDPLAELTLREGG